jgi:hypothetical protein
MLSACAPAFASEDLAAPGTDATVEAPVKGLLFGSENIFVEFHGFLNVEGYSFQKQATTPNSSFDLNNWFFSAKVEPVKKVTIFAEVAYQHGTQDIQLDRAFGDWTAAPWATLRIGRFYSPLSYQRNHDLAPVSLLVSQPLMASVGLADWSDTGVEAFGSPSRSIKWLQYDVAVVNGPHTLADTSAGQFGLPAIGQDDRDSYAAKTVIGRVNFLPLDGLTLGAAYASGKCDNSQQNSINISELDARWTTGRLDVRAEYMNRTGDDEIDASPIPGGETQIYYAQMHGWYAQAAYDLIRDRDSIKFLRPVVRFDTLKTSATESGTNRVTVGLDYSPASHLLVKGEYEMLRQFGQAQQAGDGAMMSLVLDF